MLFDLNTNSTVCRCADNLNIASTDIGIVMNIVLYIYTILYSRGVRDELWHVRHNTNSTYSMVSEIYRSRLVSVLGGV
jgi:hypothetical protein